MRLDFSLISRLARITIDYFGEHCSALLSVSVDYTCTIVCETALGCTRMFVCDEKRLDNQGLNTTLDAMLTARGEQYAYIQAAIRARYYRFSVFTYRDTKALLN